jgi:SAM-dependent methyltransferase
MTTMRVERISLPVLSSQPPLERRLQTISYRLRTFRSILDLLPPRTEGRSLVDLGAGPCLFAKLAAKEAFRVTAVDVRPPWNIDGSPLPLESLAGIDFVQADACRFDVSGFDVVSIVGLLYHLTLSEQIDLLSRCGSRTVIIDTEVFDDAAMSESARERISPAAEAMGYDGIDWQETGHVWSSKGNHSSFWHTVPSLLRMFENTGAQNVTVFEPQYRSAHGPRQWYLLNAPALAG